MQGTADPYVGVMAIVACAPSGCMLLLASYSTPNIGLLEYTCDGVTLSMPTPEYGLPIQGLNVSWLVARYQMSFLQQPCLSAARVWCCITSRSPYLPQRVQLLLYILQCFCRVYLEAQHIAAAPGGGFNNKRSAKLGLTYAYRFDLPQDKHRLCSSTNNVVAGAMSPVHLC